MKKMLIAFICVVFLISCGDEKSNKNPIEPEIEISMSSSFLKESSSSVKPKESSSSMKKSSSSTKLGKSSSSTKESSSSVKPDESSSSTKEISSSVKPDESSSSAKESSSSVKPGESSSSTKESSSSVKPDESSSSTKESSSSVKPADSSSSESSSSSDIADSSGASTAGICKTKTEDNCIYGTVYDDRDGKTYKTVKIGEQEWMAENLNYEVSIISNTSIWSTCYKGGADSCVIKYGRYYTWTAAIDSISLYTQYSIQCGAGKKCSPSDTVKIKGVCPNGWHLPNQKEWEKLVNFVGVSKAGDVLKSFSDWENWPGIDSYGFSVLPSGVVHNASFSNRGNKSYLWTATDHDNYSAQCAQFNYSQARKDVVMFQSERKSAVEALPVRCVKN